MISKMSNNYQSYLPPITIVNESNKCSCTEENGNCLSDSCINYKNRKECIINNCKIRTKNKAILIVETIEYRKKHFQL